MEETIPEVEAAPLQITLLTTHLAILGSSECPPEEKPSKKTKRRKTLLEKISENLRKPSDHAKIFHKETTKNYSLINNNPLPPKVTE